MTGRLPIRVGIAGAEWYGGVFNSDAVGKMALFEYAVDIYFSFDVLLNL